MVLYSSILVSLQRLWYVEGVGSVIGSFAVLDNRDPLLSDGNSLTEEL